MIITNVQLLQVREGIPFTDLEALSSALRTLGAIREEDPAKVSALVAKLQVTITNGTHVATDLLQHVKRRELREAGVPHDELARAYTEFSPVLRKTFLHNVLSPLRTPFIDLAIRAEKRDGAYVLKLTDRERRAGTEAMLAAELGIARVLVQAGVECRVEPTGRHGENVEFDLDVVMNGPRDIGLTSLTGEAAAGRLMAMAERIARVRSSAFSSDLEMESNGHRARLGVCGADPTDGDIFAQDHEVLWRRDGATISGPRSASVLHEDRLEQPTFHIMITPTDDPVASDRLLGLAERLVKIYRWEMPEPQRTSSRPRTRSRRRVSGRRG